MSKASAALRRGGVRLRSLGSGRTPLNLLISEHSNTRQKYKDLIRAQISLSQTLEGWLKLDDDPALQDVLHHVCELNLLWAESQRDFVVSLKQYKKVYEDIREMEKKLDSARKQLSQLEDKEKKLQKELAKGPKDPTTIQVKLQEATDAKVQAQVDVSEIVCENGSKKPRIVKQGLIELSSAWSNMGNKCSILAEAQKALAILIPDPSSPEGTPIFYTGAGQSNQVVCDTRYRIELLQVSQSMSTQSIGRSPGSNPPPPHRRNTAPTDPPPERRGRTRSSPSRSIRSLTPTAPPLQYDQFVYHAPSFPSPGQGDNSVSEVFYRDPNVGPPSYSQLNLAIDPADMFSAGSDDSN